jgi:hypothetical protein
LCAVEPLPLTVVTEAHTHFLPDRTRVHNAALDRYALRQRQSPWLV